MRYRTLHINIKNCWWGDLFSKELYYTIPPRPIVLYSLLVKSGPKYLGINEFSLSCLKGMRIVRSSPHDCFHSLHDKNVNSVHGDQEHGLPPGKVYTRQINGAQCQIHARFGICLIAPKRDKCCVKYPRRCSMSALAALKAEIMLADWSFSLFNKLFFSFCESCSV